MTHVLQDKTITGIEIAKDKQAMRFFIEGGEPLKARADGDCCSFSWIEHISLPAGGFPAKVFEITSLELPGSYEKDYEYVQVYGLKIVTDKGEMVIDYRNSSNGYYGGNLSWGEDDRFYGGVHGQNVSDEEWQPLNSDV